MKKAASLAEAFKEIFAADATLSAKLAAYADTLRELNSPFAAAYDALAARLLVGEIGRHGPAVGEEMPEFILPAKDGALLRLSDLARSGPLVVSLNRGHWCPFCKIELGALARYHDEIKAHGAEVVSILPDRQEVLAALREATLHKLHILSDIDNGYALSIGLAVWLGDEIRGLMQSHGLNLEAYQGSEGWIVPQPATFVVDQDKRIVARFVDHDFRKRMDVDAILAALRAIDG